MDNQSCSKCKLFKQLPLTKAIYLLTVIAKYELLIYVLSIIQMNQQNLNILHS